MAVIYEVISSVNKIYCKIYHYFKGLISRHFYFIADMEILILGGGMKVCVNGIDIWHAFFYYRPICLYYKSSRDERIFEIYSHQNNKALEESCHEI